MVPAPPVLYQVPIEGACRFTFWIWSDVRSSATCLIWSTTSARPGWVEVAGGVCSHFGCPRHQGV